MTRFLDGRRALVVGGSGGIGRAVSICLAELGANLCIHGGHSQERLRDAAIAAREKGVEVTELLLDVTDCRQAASILKAAGDVDILVVSFGPYIEQRLATTSPEQWERMVGLNLILPGLLVSGVLPAMIAQKWGRIVLFGGPRSDVIRGYRLIAAYAAAKHGLASLTRSVALQYSESNVRCNMICPGYVDTEYYTPDQRLRVQAKLPTGRLVSVNEVAALARFLMSPESEAINGALIPVDFGV